MTQTDDFPTLEMLPREQLLLLAHEYMLSGMMVTRGVMPMVVVRGGDLDLMNTVAIDEWMGASPVYTGRMRALMGIEGNDIAAIMKALQLDVGFVHQYMDVVYTITDSEHGEFYLAHCGALIDAEAHGEDRVFGMCHTIEDPTFDATALATNPRARIRPIHRPPRTPANRNPHCHWTIVIDETNVPVGPIALTSRVAELALASIPNAVETYDDGVAGRDDYRHEFASGLRLADFSTGAVAAVTREFQTQSHLLIASSDLALHQYFDAATASGIVVDAWLGSSWLAAERLARVFDLGTGARAVAKALALTPMIPSGLTRELAVVGDRVSLILRATTDGLLDPAHPGWLGLVAQGNPAGFEGVARALGCGFTDFESSLIDNVATIKFSAAPETAPSPEPDVVALGRIGRVANWMFQTAIA